jgi:hypothetical protein
LTLTLPSAVPRREEGKQFFFEKKNQKTFIIKALMLPRRARHRAKFLLQLA